MNISTDQLFPAWIIKVIDPMFNFLQLNLKIDEPDSLISSSPKYEIGVDRELIEVPVPKEDLLEILEKIKDLFKEYNRYISGSGYYLKPIHFVTKNVKGEKRKFIYLGRYWWKIVYLGRSEKGGVKLKWIYIGRTKPSGLPDPPGNPLEGLSIYTKEGSEDVYFIKLKGNEKNFIEKIETVLGRKFTG